MRASRLIFRPVLAALAATFVVRVSAAAQTHLDVVPYVGLYVPTASMVSGDSFVIPPVTQQATFAVGARVTVWLPSGLGIESTFGYAPSSVNSGATYECCNAAHVVIASNRVLVPVVASGPVLLRLGGGLGLVAHGGRAYIHTGGATALAGVASGGLAIKLYGSRLRTHLGHSEEWRQRVATAGQPVSRVRITDRVGFEPTVPLRAHRFSRPAVSTAHAPVQAGRSAAEPQSRRSIPALPPNLGVLERKRRRLHTPLGDSHSTIRSGIPFWADRRLTRWMTSSFAAG